MGRKLTPAQQQYMDLKQQHKDALLFFRMGDFYETFYEDAHITHKILEITLTTRDKQSENPIPMAGIPYHSLDKYSQKLLDAGYKIAIAEQMSAPVPGQIVERKVVQVLTPGTIIEEGQHFNYIAGLSYTGAHTNSYHIARGDVSLGMRHTASFATREQALKQIFALEPREIIIDIDVPDRDGVEQYIHDVLQLVVSFDDVPHNLEQYIQQCTNTESLAGYGSALDEGRASVIGLLFSYIQRMQQDKLLVHSVAYQTPDSLVLFDDITKDNLEIFSSRYEGSKTHSLYHILNTTNTAGGARLLRHRLSTPIRHVPSLQYRFDHISYYLHQSNLINPLNLILKQLPDLPRVLAKLLSRHASPQILQSFSIALDILYHGEYADIMQSALLYAGCSETHYTTIGELASDLQKALIDEPIVDGKPFIKKGYNVDIDTCRQTAYHADELLLQYQKDIQQHAEGIPVKVKYVKNQGYVLEVTPKYITQFESCSEQDNPLYNFVRGQTLKTGQRYMTPYLQELQEKIYLATEELQEKEYALFVSYQDRIQELASMCSSLFDALASIDLSLTMTTYIQQQGWSLPEISNSYALEIQQGRHPVVEYFLPNHESFISNDVDMHEKSSFHILTGPNMGGKSTFLRQNALIVLLAHAGLPVPAKKAKVPLVDALFARIGAGDALAKNQSTFMTEMLETANILHNATKNSFIILDELGRGTSTYDGLALAKSISVHISQHIGAKTLFATHYHELTDLEEEYKNVQNFSVSVYETNKEVVFLKKVVTGKANKSYGIDVAKLAGMPASVLQDAITFLDYYETKHHHQQPVQIGFDFGVMHDQYQKYYTDMKDFLEDIHIDEISPIEALLHLQDIKKRFPLL